MNKQNAKKREEKVETLVKKATNPKQYDSYELNYGKEKETPSPVRQVFQYHLKKHLGNLTGKKVIDIGSGTGHLSKLLFELGAKEVYGIEPSRRNVGVSEKFFPKMFVIKKALKDVKIEKVFDIAIIILTLEHMKNLNSAFSKITKLIKTHGLLYVIAGDKKYNTTKRFGYRLKITGLNNDEVIVTTKRMYGTMYDIFRPVSNFIKAAEKTGFSFKKHIPITPTKKLIRTKPKYTQFVGKAIAHLLIFEHVRKA